MFEPSAYGITHTKTEKLKAISEATIIYVKIPGKKIFDVYFNHKFIIYFPARIFI